MGKNRQLRVAIIGHRGIPNAYGGFETLAEELSSCLVSLGCKVTVYCRTQYFKDRKPSHKGAGLIYLPTVKSRSLDTLVHTLISVFHVIFRNTADIVLVVNIGNAPSALIAKLFGKKVIFCVDGLDWQRKKWGFFARNYLRACSYIAKFVSHEIVTDAASVYDFYKKDRRAESTLIPYGTEIEAEHELDFEVLKEYGLEPKKYFVYVARFEPENHPTMVAKAYNESGSKLPLVMVGDNRYNQEFVSEIKNAAGRNVIFTGYLFGGKYKQLVKNSLASVRAAEVGGLSPAVIEAMGRSVCVIANEKPENREALGETGLYFDLNKPEELTAHFKRIADDPGVAIELGKKSAQRAMLLYSWDTIAFEYLKLIKKLASQIENKDKTIGPNPGQSRKKILITGANGMLGRAFYKSYSKNYIVKATTAHPKESWQEKLDVTDQNALEEMISVFRPDFIIHAAALADLEKCEQSLPQAYTVNTLSTKYLSQLSAKYGATMIFISSANVFNGEKSWYDESDEPSPINVYGLTKHMGELMTKYYAPSHIIVRLGWLIGGGMLYDKKFIGKIVRQLESGSRDLFVVTDKFGSISYAPDVAEMLGKIMQNGGRGTYHLVSPGAANRHEIAQRIVDGLGYQKMVRLVPVRADYFSGVYSTPRPAHECLLNKRITGEDLAILRPWSEALKDYLITEFPHAFNSEIPEREDLMPGIALA